MLEKELENQTRYKKVQVILKTRYKKVQVILETHYKKVQNILETRYKKVQVFILRNIKMFKRKILDEINKWKNSLSIKKRALVIKGLRQIGKTTVVLNYCKKNYENLVYINFMENKSIKKIFDNDLVVDDLIRDISAAIPTARFIPQKTVIFFDEIQECASARTSIKSFMIDGRFDIIATGSLLGLRGYNQKEQKSIPTGFEYVVSMFPMDFEEYLWARGIDDSLIEYINNCFVKKEIVSDVVNDSFLNYFKEYLCVGGMPDAVDTFLKTRDMNQVRDVQRNILEEYKDDFGKHLDKYENERIDKLELTRIIDVYNSIPYQLAKENNKFQFSDIRKGAKGREYKNAITWLEEFGLVKRSYNLNNLELPLEGNKNPDEFKLFLSDTGLFVAMLDEGTTNDIINGNLKIFKGAIFENIVADAFIKNGNNLYYFSKNSGLEIDFITKFDGKLTPVEVKATNGNAKSLKEVINNKNKYGVDSALKLIDGNIGYSNGIYTIPLYMAFLID